ncbi:hypothetical protein M8494_14785 [Serratia ureilytica]
MLVYSVKTRAIETNLFTPIERITDCIANDIPVKRGVLLGGHTAPVVNDGGDRSLAFGDRQRRHLSVRAAL